MGPLTQVGNARPCQLLKNITFPASAILKRYINWQIDKQQRKLFQVIITATEVRLTSKPE